MKKRLLACLLTLALLLALLPTAALAANTTLAVSTADELVAAFGSASTNEEEPTVIKLKNDIILGSTLTLETGKYVTLAGGNFTITRSDDFGSESLQNLLTVKGNLSINNAKFNAKGNSTHLFRVIIVDGGTLTMSDSVVEGGYGQAGGVGLLSLGNQASTTLTRCEITKCSGKNAVVTSQNGASVIVNNCKIHDNEATGNGTALLSNNAHLGIYGGEIYNNTAYQNLNTGDRSLANWATAVFSFTDLTMSGDVKFYDNYVIDRVTDPNNEIKYRSDVYVNGTVYLTSQVENTIVFWKRMHVRTGEIGNPPTAAFIGKDGYGVTKSDFSKIQLAYGTYETNNKDTSYPFYDNSALNLNYVLALYYVEGDQSIRIRFAKKVIFNGNGGLTSEGQNTATQNVPIDVETQLAANPFVKSGYAFTEWNTAEDGSGTSYAKDAAVTLNNEGLTLYAQWAQKPAQAAPATAPTLKDRTYTSITLNTVAPNDHNAPAQYSKDGGATWQDSPEFTDLTAGMSYTFAVRYAETAEYAASESSPTAAFETIVLPTPVIPVTPSAPAKNPFNPDAGKAKFTDVSDNAWYASAVNYAVDKGLMNGTGNNKFSPNADTTRGMIVTILARLDGKNTSGTPWYQAGQRWAMEYEISDGTKMESAITREQLVTMLFRYAVKNGMDAVTLAENLSRFTDASNVSAWAVPAMQWAVSQGLIQGSNGLLRPQANASRAEVATILLRFCELLNK